MSNLRESRFRLWWALPLIALSAPAQATIFNWNAGSGNFLTAGNWTPGGGPPDDSSDTAVFDRFAAYTVNMDNQLMVGVPIRNQRLEVTSGTVAFDMFDVINPVTTRAYQYELQTISGGAAHIGSAPGAFFPATLIVQGGFGNDPNFPGFSTISAVSFLHIGRDANSKGVLELDGAEWESDDTTFVGLNGQGTLAIRGIGGRMENATGIVGFAAGSSGTVSISSGGSWLNSGDLTIGALGAGSVTVSDGTLITFGPAALATQIGSSGTADIRDTWLIDDHLYVGGNATTAGGTGSLTISSADNDGVQVQGDMKVYSTGSLTLNDGLLRVHGHLQWLKPAALTVDGDDTLRAGQLTITSGGSLVYSSDQSPLAATPMSLGQLNAPADSFTWTSGRIVINAGDFAIGGGTPLGIDETINADKWLTVSGALRIGQAGAAVVTVNGGGLVASDAGFIGNDAANVGSAVVQLFDGGTTWTIANDLRVGGRDSVQLTIAGGADVSNASAMVAVDALATANILVLGANSQWDSSGDVYLGGSALAAGGTGTTEVLLGAQLNASGMVRVWDEYVLSVEQATLTTPTLSVAGTANFDTTLDLTGSGSIGVLVLDGGTVNAPVIDFGENAFAGFGALNGKVIVGGNVTATGDLTLGDPTRFDGFEIGGDLHVGGHDVLINKRGFFNLGASTRIVGGALTVSDGVAVPVGAALAAFGAINGRFVQQSGSVIEASGGGLTLGDATSPSGFFSDGELNVNAHTVALRDANDALLGSLTTLGDAGAPGVLIAANGAVVEFGKNLTGFGTVDTPDDPLRPLINNGHISGNSPAEPITLTGHVKGLGTLDNVVITGTDAPGFSPATVYRGSVSYDGTLQIDVEGAATGAFDRIEHILSAGVADLGGTLEVLADPAADVDVGDLILFLYAQGGIFNAFESITLPLLDGGKAFRLLYGETIVGLEVILAGDYNQNGVVDAADYVLWRKTPDAFGGDPDGYNTWRANFGSTAASSAAAGPAGRAAVPEPGCLALFLLAFVLLLKMRCIR